MATQKIAQKWIDEYLEWQKPLADPKTDGYPLMEDPFSILSILASYLLIVYWGPKFMQNRKPYALSTFMHYYNLAQIFFCSYYIINIYLLTEVTPNGLYLMCKRMDHSTSPVTERIAFFQYVNFVARILELSETIVHILRKKTRLVSNLHVTHHTLNVSLAWIITRFRPGGSASTICMINFSVHLVMFIYYWASQQEGTVYQEKARAFKRYLTLIQMVQFFLMLIIVGQDMWLDRCGPTDSYIGYATISVITVNIIMFTNFYIQTYKKKKTE